MDKKRTLEKACRLIREAGRNGAELIVFPEGFVSGYPAYYTGGWESRVHEWAPYMIAFQDNALTVNSEDTAVVGEAARSAGASVLMGCNEMDARPGSRTVYNCMVFLGKDGKVMGRHRKLIVTYTERTYYGTGDAADLAVFETDIGRIGLMICMEGSFCDIGRGYGLQGAEVVFRCSYGDPYVSGGAPGWWEIQNRARALDNCFYMVCPNDGPRYPDEAPYNMCGGLSMIVSYRGEVMSACRMGTEGYCNATINIEALRYQRATAKFGTWIPQLKTEYYRKFYDRVIWPKNLRIAAPPPPYSQQDKIVQIVRDNIAKLQKDGVYIAPDTGKKA